MVFNKKVGRAERNRTYVLLEKGTFFSKKSRIMGQKERKKYLQFVSEGFILKTKVEQSGVKSLN